MPTAFPSGSEERTGVSGRPTVTHGLGNTGRKARPSSLNYQAAELKFI